FYHAAKNRLVEIIPGRKTASETIREARRFAEMTGKDPIFCKDRYGFAVNRFFVPWLNEAVRLLEDGVADTATIDAVCRKTFQIGMGPFALMNATGVPIAYHSQKTLEVLGPFYQVAPLLKEQAESNQLWEIPEIDESKISENIARTISERMLGVVFLVCSQILDEEVCSATELNRGARIGLRWRKGPVELMQLMGETEVQRLIEQIASRYNTPLPMTIHPDYWQLKWVQYEKKGDLAIITISRPEDLNALNETVVEQLSAKFDKALSDSEVKKVLITGSGKAFMAGADIKFFVKNMKQHRLERIVEFTRRGQELFEKIDHSPKPVIALVNGLALGGGLELALCADLIFAASGATMAFPETGIGIYPGLGGTYRTPSRVGKAMAKYLIFSGKMLTAWEAWEIGLIDGVLTREELFFIKEGIMKIPDRQPAPPITGTKWEKIKQLFERMSLKDLLEKEVLPAAPEKEVLEKIRKVLKRKAPIPLRIVEELIDRAESPKQELEYLEQVFSSEDALTGLSNIGKPVTFQGK
ncbi:MAG: 3-hydroxyacyl-CoA dehydrogenase/enoyl-CoA hydratase family protein, partial [Methanobacteriota archaeon]